MEALLILALVIIVMLMIIVCFCTSSGIKIADIFLDTNEKACEKLQELRGEYMLMRKEKTELIIEKAKTENRVMQYARAVKAIEDELGKYEDINELENKIKSILEMTAKSI